MLYVASKIQRNLSSTGTPKRKEIKLQQFVLCFGRDVPMQLRSCNSQNFNEVSDGYIFTRFVSHSSVPAISYFLGSIRIGLLWDEVTDTWTNP